MLEKLTSLSPEDKRLLDEQLTVKEPASLKSFIKTTFGFTVQVPAIRAYQEWRKEHPDIVVPPASPVPSGLHSSAETEKAVPVSTSVPVPVSSVTKLGNYLLEIVETTMGSYRFEPDLKTAEFLSRLLPTTAKYLVEHSVEAADDDVSDLFKY